MAGIEVKTFDKPDETRPFEGKGQVHAVEVGGHVVGKAVFEPGWRWSTNVKPIAGTESCQTSHLGYCLSGRLHIVMDDGSEQDLGPGDVAAIPPGHDAEVRGDEACVMLDFGAIEEYARRR
jgi:mannose-6-phosphate isomerase-like protein (cupin superfamily)